MSQVLRIIDGEAVWVDKRKASRPPGAPKPKVDTLGLGCIPQDVDSMRADAKMHGFKVEFEPDPTSMEGPGDPNFYNCRLNGSEAERQRYIRHRGMEDRNSRNGSAAGITAVELAQAEVLARRLGGQTRKTQD